MVQLDLDNVYLKITGLEKDIEIKLWNELSFGIQIFGVPEIRYRHLYNRKTKKTYAGLLDYVKDFFKEKEIDYILNDNRVKPEQNANFKLVDYIDSDKKIPLKLRPYQQDIINKCREREVIQAATGAGKALPLDTDILTPNGFVKMRDIHVGSVVYDENGEKTNVIAEFPQSELKQEYKITFNDGSYVICCKDHLWKYDVKTNIKHHKWKVNNIVDIINKYGLKKNKSLNIYIPVCKPIKFDKKELFIPPYLMGALLGDGGFTQNTISFTNVEKDVIDKVNLLVSTWGVFKHRKNKSHPQLHFVGGKNNLFKKYIENTFHHANSKTKFIPNEYKMSSIEDRLELIRGLIDTDGSINEKGHIKIGFVSEQLAKDLQFVLQSLGYRSKMTIGKRKGKNNTYNLYIRGCDDKLFSSIKHKERFKHRKVGKNHHYDILKIVSVEPLDKKSEMKCITVDSPLHTYICKDFIVTHNTLMMAGCIAKFNVKPVCIFADKIGLCQQLKQEMEKFLGVEVGLVGDGIEDYKDITVISVQSADDNYIKNAQMCLWDECLLYHSRILLEDGKYEEIGRLVSKLSKGEHFNVWTYNIETKKFEVKPVIDYGKMNIGNKKIVKINIKQPNGKIKTIRCTDNHKIFIKNKNQYVEAKNLVKGDKVIIAKRMRHCNQCNKNFSFKGWPGHVSSVHKGLNDKHDYICPVCEKKLNCSLAIYKAPICTHDKQWVKNKGLNISKSKKEFYQDNNRSFFARTYMSEYMKNNNPMNHKNVINKMVKSRHKYFDNLSDDEYSKLVQNFINASPYKQTEPTLPEQRIINLHIDGLYYNGCGEHIIDYRFKDKSYKNSVVPDFIYHKNQSDEKFIEIFGEYWHKPGEDTLLKEAYEKNNMKVLILWEYEPMKQQIQKINEFLGVEIKYDS